MGSYGGGGGGDSARIFLKLTSVSDSRKHFRRGRQHISHRIASGWETLIRNRWLNLKSSGGNKAFFVFRFVSKENDYGSEEGTTASRFSSAFFWFVVGCWCEIMGNTGTERSYLRYCVSLRKQLWDGIRRRQAIADMTVRFAHKTRLNFSCEKEG